MIEDYQVVRFRVVINRLVILDVYIGRKHNIWANGLVYNHEYSDAQGI